MYAFVNEKCTEKCHLLRYNAVYLAELIFSTLKMEAICSSEMSVDTQRTTLSYIPEDGTLQYIFGTLQNHCCENLKSYEKCTTLYSSILYIRIRLGKVQLHNIKEKMSSVRKEHSFHSFTYNL
jgi:hypothetical protein